MMGIDVASLQSSVIERAWKDDEFRGELLRDPKSVLAREIAKLDPDARIPDGVNIKVVEETPTTFFLVLPNSPSAIADMMSDEDLVDAGIAKFSTPAGVGAAVSLEAARTRRCRCHRTWATLYLTGGGGEEA